MLITPFLIISWTDSLCCWFSSREAGQNHNNKSICTDVSFQEFSRLTHANRTKIVFGKLKEMERDLRLLSPSECINGLTIGALFNDFSSVTENSNVVLPVESGIISPISAIGLGISRSIKPDIYFNGGRKLVCESPYPNTIRWSSTLREPGCCVASPSSNGGANGKSYIFGTSPAAAQVTHESGFCYEILNEIFLNELNMEVPKDFAFLLVKTMIIHGATWRPLAARLSQLISVSEKRLAKWLGYGIPNISRVEQGAKNRITVLGYGTLKNGKAHIYRLPLPFDFSSGRIYRRLTVTLSYCVSIAPDRQNYKSSQLWFTLSPESAGLFTEKENTDIYIVQRGTSQHEIFSGEQAVTWDEDNGIDIKVNCRNIGSNLDIPTPYCIFVTFEVAEGLSIDIYTKILQRIKQEIIIKANP